MFRICSRVPFPFMNTVCCPELHMTPFVVLCSIVLLACDKKVIIRQFLHFIGKPFLSYSIFTNVVHSVGHFPLLRIFLHMSRNHSIPFTLALKILPQYYHNQVHCSTSDLTKLGSRLTLSHWNPTKVSYSPSLSQKRFS